MFVPSKKEQKQTTFLQRLGIFEEQKLIEQTLKMKI